MSSLSLRSELSSRGSGKDLCRLTKVFVTSNFAFPCLTVSQCHPFSRAFSKCGEGATHHAAAHFPPFFCFSSRLTAVEHLIAVHHQPVHLRTECFFSTCDSFTLMTLLYFLLFMCLNPLKLY